ncbi:fimbrial biogenesis chaperone [Yersinia aleksiciae]|nr:hypothetical protein [Yersinia aleksiciae]
MKGNQLVIKNASPYYITFRKIELRASKEGLVLANLSKTNNKMVAPLGEISLSVAAKGLINNTTQVFYSIINDQGGEVLVIQKLTQ